MSYSKSEFNNFNNTKASKPLESLLLLGMYILLNILGYRHIEYEYFRLWMYINLLIGLIFFWNYPTISGDYNSLFSRTVIVTQRALRSLLKSIFSVFGGGHERTPVMAEISQSVNYKKYEESSRETRVKTEEFQQSLRREVPSKNERKKYGDDIAFVNSSTNEMNYKNSEEFPRETRVEREEVRQRLRKVPSKTEKKSEYPEDVNADRKEKYGEDIVFVKYSKSDSVIFKEEKSIIQRSNPTRKELMSEMSRKSVEYDQIIKDNEQKMRAEAELKAQQQSKAQAQNLKPVVLPTGTQKIETAKPQEETEKEAVKPQASFLSNLAVPKAEDATKKTTGVIEQPATVVDPNKKVGGLFGSGAGTQSQPNAPTGSDSTKKVGGLFGGNTTQSLPLNFSTGVTGALTGGKPAGTGGLFAGTNAKSVLEGTSEKPAGSNGTTEATSSPSKNTSSKEQAKPFVNPIGGVPAQNLTFKDTIKNILTSTFENGWKVMKDIEEKLKRAIANFNEHLPPTESKLNENKYLKLNEEYLRVASNRINTFGNNPSQLFNTAMVVIDCLHKLKGIGDLYSICIRMLAQQILKKLESVNGAASYKLTFFYNILFVKIIDGHHKGFADYFLFEITQACPILKGKVTAAKADKKEKGYQDKELFKYFDTRLMTYSTCFYMVATMNVRSALNELGQLCQEEMMTPPNMNGPPLGHLLHQIAQYATTDHTWLFWESLTQIVKSKNVNACTPGVLLAAQISIPYLNKKFHPQLKELGSQVMKIVIPELEKQLDKFESEEASDYKNNKSILLKWNKIAGGDLNSFKTALMESKEREIQVAQAAEGDD